MMRDPRILALVTDAFGGKGGIARYNRDLLSAWARTASVHVVPRAAGVIGDLPAGVTQEAPGGGRLAYVLKVVRAGLARRPSLVFCGHLYMAPLAWAVARLTGAHLVLQVHGIDAWEEPGALRRFACERADWILSVSRYTRSRVLTWAAIEPERVIVLPNTVDERFTPGDRRAARARFGFGDGPVILSVGRLDARERYKGQDEVIAVLPDLVRGNPDVVYAIAGEGDDRARLETLAASSGVGASVRFLGGVLDEALEDLYRSADLFALPSSGEGFGIVFLEAMACGTPALGLAVAGAVDALQDGRLGTACAPADLASALARLIDERPIDEARRSAEAGALAARVRQVFGANVFRERADATLALVAS